MDVSWLEEPFSHDEIDQVVAQLPSDKSPGPEGFNTDLLRNVGQSSNMIFMSFVKPFIKGMFACKASMVHTSHLFQKWMLPHIPPIQANIPPQHFSENNNRALGKQSSKSDHLICSSKPIWLH